jgi:pyruvate,water dikinase
LSSIVNLDKNSRWPQKTIGTKAFNLQKMMLLGINVPACSVVTTNAYKESIQGRITETLQKELSSKFSNWHLPIIARSSSLAEDKKESSKAGVFATITDIRDEYSLINAIEKVWSSSSGEDIAVIIQKQLKPDIAGVLFTRDPVTGANEHVIEYVEGMGESLVSGKKDPIRVRATDNRFKELIKIGKQLESMFGYPLDIEWAMTEKTFHILQARPVTALPVPPKENNITYSMVLAEQFFSGPSSPLFFSIFKFLFEEYYARETAREVGLDVLPKEPLLIRYRDHMYVNTFSTQYLLRKAGKLGNFQQQLKVLPEDIRKEFEESKQKNILFAAGLLAKIAILIIKRPELRRSNVDLEFIRKTVPIVLNGLEMLNDQPDTRDELKQQYRILLDLTIEHIRSSKWGLAYCIMLSSLLQRFLEKNHITGADIKLLALMSGLPSEKTSKGIDELQILAYKYRQDKIVKDIINQNLESYQEYREKLAENTEGLKFTEAFESILSRYGHRRLARDIIHPSWKDEPTIPFTMVRNIILNEDLHNIIETREIGIKKRNEVSQQILKQIPIYKRRRFNSHSKYLLRYLSFRELQRFYLDMILSRMRVLILTIGEKMAEVGIIEDRNDIFFLTKDEIEGYLNGDNTNLGTKAAFRKMTFCESSTKPKLYLRNGVDFDTISSVDTDQTFGNKVRGESVSAGIFKGKVKVIEYIDSGSSILPGTVLVTKSIDPGQTQLFTSAGGLILEVGGVLSHGAILAREFGIPTVAQVKGATKRFRDGQEVVVDGTKGEVVLVEGGE